MSLLPIPVTVRISAKTMISSSVPANSQAISAGVPDDIELSNM